MRTFVTLFGLFFVFATPAFAADYYLDNDGDGYGQTTVKQASTATAAPTGYAADSGDCNDTDAAINPDATEGWGQAGDKIDQDCDGSDRPLPTIPTDATKKFKKNYPTMTTLALARTYGYCGETAGCVINNTDGKFEVTTAGQALCDMTVSRGYWKLWDENQCAQTAGLMSRGSGGLGKSIVEKMITDGNAPLAARIDEVAQASYDFDMRLDERIEVLNTAVLTDNRRLNALEAAATNFEHRLDDLEAADTEFADDLDEIFNSQVGLVGGTTSHGVVVLPEASRMSKVEAGVTDLSDNGIMVLGSFGGNVGYQRPYAVQKGGKNVRDAMFGSVGVGGFLGGRFGQFQMGASGLGTRTWDPSYGNSFTLGLEGTYFHSNFGFGLFLGGGSHESGGKPPVESTVIGRYGLVGLQGVYNVPINGYGMLQVVPRLSAGVEVFGTKANDGTKDVVDAQPGALLMLSLELRAGAGPKGI